MQWLGNLVDVHLQKNNIKKKKEWLYTNENLQAFLEAVCMQETRPESPGACTFCMFPHMQQVNQLTSLGWFLVHPGNQNKWKKKRYY
jgi:hypothetical protein